MHHITYKDYAGVTKVVKLPAAQIATVLFLTRQLKESSVKYTHIFWD